MSRKDGSKRSGKEVEIKLRVPDRAALLRRLEGLKAKLARPRVHEMNVLYDTPDGALARRGQLLRVRAESSAPRVARGAGKTGKSKRVTGPWNALLTYKGRVEDASEGASGAREGRLYKVRDEREVRVMDQDGIASILTAMGLFPWFRYEKYRSTYRLPGLGSLKVELDETPAGDFLELEGVRGAIDRSAKLLGYGAADYITQSYGSLWREHRGHGPGEPSPGFDLEDMLFSKAK
jgi:adenylate cyclase, class 2